MTSWTLASLVLGSAVLAGAHGAESDTPLRVCMNEDSPMYSKAHGESGSGFDVDLGRALAAHLGRPLAIQWYETKLDEDSSSTLEANALLSDGRCDVIAGYPMVATALGTPGFKTARLPDFRGTTPADRRRRVELGTLVPTHPYQRSPLVLVLGPGVAPRQVAGLDDVADLHFGVEGGTLEDAILMLYKHGKLVQGLTHYAPGRGEVLGKLESGEIDASFVALIRLDAYRKDHPGTRIRSSGYNYPLAFNLGYVGLSTNAALLARISEVLDQMRASGEVAAIARAAGVTYVEPAEPLVSPGVSFVQLQQD
jgi:ABC-type amino acid transport substrate-binding protein